MTPSEAAKLLYTQKIEFQNWFNNVAPDILGTEAVNHFAESFQNEGFTDETLEKWPDVKRRTNPKRPDRAAASRPILTGSTGDLGRSIEYVAKPGEVKITADTMQIGSDKAYAQAHNEGTTTAGRGNRTTIPKRQFIGESKALNDKVLDISDESLRRFLK